MLLTAYKFDSPTANDNCRYVVTHERFSDDCPYTVYDVYFERSGYASTYGPFGLTGISDFGVVMATDERAIKAIEAVKRDWCYLHYDYEETAPYAD